MNRLARVLPIGLALALAGAAAAQSFAVRARAIYTASDGGAAVISHGTMVVREGRIIAVGADVAVPEDLELIELRDAYICPGFVSLGGGLVRPHSGPESTSAAYRAADAFDKYADYTLALSRGTLTAYVGPGEHRLISGVGAVVRLAGPAETRVLVSDADLVVNLGVFDPPPLFKPPFYASADVAIQPSVLQRPDSRLGMLEELRERLAAAVSWPGVPGGVDSPTFDYHLAALAAAWSRPLPLRIEAREKVDIAAAIKLVSELRKGKAEARAYLVGAQGFAGPLDVLAAGGLPVALRIDDGFRGPGREIGRDPDALDARARDVVRLADAVQRLALAGPADERGEDLRMIAILARRGGLDENRALAAITRVPAELLGIADRTGSLAPGKDADFLVLSAPPLDLRSRVISAHIAGSKVFEYPSNRPQRSAAASDYTPPTPDPLVVRAGRIWTGDGPMLQDAEVLVENGKIASVGYRVPAPPRARVIDAGDRAVVVPGFIDAHGHLGLDGDKTAATPDLPIHRVLGVAGPDFQRVAQAGVTTVMLAPYRVAPNGGRVAAIKTFGDDPEAMVVRDMVGLKFTLVGKDPVTEIESLRRTIEAGKKYDEEWRKYEDELKKWREGGKPAEKPKSEAKVEESRPDPITGTWLTRISGGPLPQPVEGTMKLRLLDGGAIEGRIADPTSGEEAPLTGSLTGDQVKLEVDVDTPVGKPTVTATLDRDDHMVGKVAIANFSIDFEATRTDKSPVEFKVKRQRGRVKDGRPAAPKIDDNLEPVRALLAGKAPAVIEVADGGNAHAALKLFVDEFKIPVIMLGSTGDDDVTRLVEARRDAVGVVPPPEPVQSRFGLPYLPAADYSRRGVRVAFQSNAEDAARSLPDVALYAAREGLGGDAALRALTVDAAKMFKLEDRVGSIAPGRDGDLLIFSGHPFDADSRLERVIVGGREVPDAP